MGNTVKISFVVPTLNEEGTIEEVIVCIKKYCPVDAYEIIIVDNGSTDNTIDIIRKLDVVVLSKPKVSISSLRNIGAEKAKGYFLVFLDADVFLTIEWKREFANTMHSLYQTAKTVTGARCSVEECDNLIIKYWFAYMTKQEPKYINSGHLVTTKKMFRIISGFDEKMETAEDYDFSQRAREAGALIVNNPKLVAIHIGYPKTVIGFIQRERWHGREDFKSFSNYCKSNQALLASFHCLLFIVCFIAGAFFHSLAYAYLYFCMMFLISYSYSYMKFKNNIRKAGIIITGLICYLYIIGRSLALMDHILDSLFFHKER